MEVVMVVYVVISRSINKTFFSCYSRDGLVEKWWNCLQSDVIKSSNQICVDIAITP